MIKTKIEFYYNTPLTDFFNTIHFKSDKERDAFFNQCIWKKYESDFSFNVEKSKGELLIPCNFLDFKKLQGLNYCRLKNDNDNRYYYYFVVKIEYINQNVSKIYLIIDALMTYTQGKVLNSLECVNVEREHLNKQEYYEYQKYLQKNDDILQCYTKAYTFENGVYFNDFYVLILTSANLTGEFGNVDNPKIVGSSGGYFDNVYSSLSLYLIDEKEFPNLIYNLSNFPWVQQHINKLILIPKIFIDLSDFKKIKSSASNSLYQAVNTLHSATSKELDKELTKLSIPFEKLIKMLGISIEELHLLRNEYISIELHNYKDTVNINVSDIDEKEGLKFEHGKVVGYENIVSIFLKNNKIGKALSHDLTTTEKFKFKGLSLNNSLTFYDFDKLPISINTHDLNIAKSANQRALAESRLFSSRLNNVISGSDNTSRLYDAISLTSNISIANLFGRLNDEYNYFKDLKASQEDMKMDMPKQLESKNSNALTRNEGIYGITLKIQTLNKQEFNKIKKYYKVMGYKVDKQIESISDIECMKYINYLKCNGTTNFKNVDTAHNEILKQTLAHGVRFWHYDEYEDGNDFNFNIKKIINNNWR